MSEDGGHRPGRIVWQDLTVEDAAALRDFYRDVVGWEPEAVDMGDYDDFNMIPSGADEPTAGICHARGGNVGIPAQWLLYITVEDLDAAAARCRERGGDVLREPGGAGGGRFCVIRDPAGAVCALYQP
jgi:predicted enzyme related to lactoylglutathione lyase